MPGFITVDAHHVTFPDYVGNNLFNTLGNLTASPQTGLLFCDFKTGETLQIIGTAQIDWERDRAERYPGAQRLVDVTIDTVVHRTHAFGPADECTA